MHQISRYLKVNSSTSAWYLPWHWHACHAFLSFESNIWYF